LIRQSFTHLSAVVVLLTVVNILSTNYSYTCNMHIAFHLHIH